MRHICGYELNKTCRKKDIEYPQNCQTADLREQYFELLRMLIVIPHNSFGLTLTWYVPRLNILAPDVRTLNSRYTNTISWTATINSVLQIDRNNERYDVVQMIQHDSEENSKTLTACASIVTDRCSQECPSTFSSRYSIQDPLTKMPKFTSYQGSIQRLFFEAWCCWEFYSYPVSGRYPPV